MTTSDKRIDANTEPPPNPSVVPWMPRPPTRYRITPMAMDRAIRHELWQDTYTAMQHPSKETPPE